MMKSMVKFNKQRRSINPDKKKTMQMLEQTFPGATAVQLVTLRYGGNYQWLSEGCCEYAAGLWIKSVALSCRAPGEPLSYMMDTSVEEGAGVAAIHRVAIERDVRALLLTRLWKYGPATVEPLDLPNGLEPVADWLMEDPAPEYGG